MHTGYSGPLAESELYTSPPDHHEGMTLEPDLVKKSPAPVSYLYLDYPNRETSKSVDAHLDAEHTPLKDTRTVKKE